MIYSKHIHMLFKHAKGTKKKAGVANFILMAIAFLCLAGGVYLLILVLTPSIPVLNQVEEINTKTLPKPTENKVYIPKIGVSIKFNTGGTEVLDYGAWHRFPERGDPVEGGNFILSAHRFEIGFTPAETRRKSPFYNIDKLSAGDQIIVDFEGKRYGYEVSEKVRVKPTQVEIEAPTEEARMTLYTCTLGGEADGREVIYAKPLGEVVDGKVSAN